MIAPTTDFLTFSPPDGSRSATPTWPEVDCVRGDAPLFVTPARGWYTSVKPAAEILAAAILLLPALPLILFAWLLIKLTSPGPGFYSQTRAGRDGRAFEIVKIRSMHHSKRVSGDMNWAKANDVRITPVGKFLRLTHLDELPQLFNVLRGEMSLVGPRPERPEVISEKGLAASVPGYDLRSEISPGVTGLAQVQLPADSDVLSVRHKVYYDLYYLTNQSLWLDIRIAAATLLKSFLSPHQLQKVCLLPTRERVCTQFLALRYPPIPAEGSAAHPAAVA